MRMMKQVNKRSFIKSLLVACVAPTVLVPRLKDAFNWKPSAENLWVPNPNWNNAPFEIAFYERLPWYLSELELKKRKAANEKHWKEFAEQIKSPFNSALYHELTVSDVYRMHSGS